MNDKIWKKIIFGYMLIAALVASSPIAAQDSEKSIYTTLIIGGTGTGKTTGVNALASFLRGQKLIFIKETALDDNVSFPSPERIERDRAENGIIVEDLVHVLPENTQKATDSQTGAIRRFRVIPKTLDKKGTIVDILDAPGLFDTRGEEASLKVEEALKKYIYNEPLTAIFIFLKGSELVRLGQEEVKKLQKVISFFPEDFISPRIFFCVNFVSGQVFENAQKIVHHHFPYLPEDALNFINFDLAFVTDLPLLADKSESELTESEEDRLFNAQRRKKRAYNTVVQLMNKVQDLQGNMDTQEWREYYQGCEQIVSLCTTLYGLRKESYDLAQSRGKQLQAKATTDATICDLDEKIKNNKCDAKETVIVNKKVNEGMLYPYAVYVVHGIPNRAQSSKPCNYQNIFEICDKDRTIDALNFEDKISKYYQECFETQGNSYLCKSCNYKIDWTDENAWLFYAANANATDEQKAKLQGLSVTHPTPSQKKCIDRVQKASRQKDWNLVRFFADVNVKERTARENWVDKDVEETQWKQIDNEAYVEQKQKAQQSLNEIESQIDDLEKAIAEHQTSQAEIRAQITHIFETLKPNYYHNERTCAELSQRVLDIVENNVDAATRQEIENRASEFLASFN